MSSANGNALDVDLETWHSTDAQRTGVTAVLACGARDAADFLLLCEAAGVATDRVSLLAARSVVRRSRAAKRRKGGRR